MTATALEALKSSALAAGSIPLEIRSPAGLSEWLAALSAVLAAAVIGYATYLSSKRQAEATRSTNKENLAEQERRHQQDLELQEWKYLHAYQTARADEARKLLHEIVCEFQDMIVDRLNKPKEYFETLDVVEKYKSTSKTVNMKFNTMRTCLDSCLPSSAELASELFSTIDVAWKTEMHVANALSKAAQGEYDFGTKSVDNDQLASIDPELGSSYRPWVDWSKETVVRWAKVKSDAVIDSANRLVSRINDELSESVNRADSSSSDACSKN